MRQGPNPKRSRGRNNSSNNPNRRPNLPLRMQTFDSNGPDVRIRGTAFQVHEKYLQLARDAASSGDRIIAESYLQHAEHYYRIIAAAQEQQAQQQGGDPNRRYRPEGGYGQDYRGPSEEGSGDGGEEFGGDDQGDGSQPRGDMYGRQQDTRYPSDVRPQQDARYHQESGQSEGRQRPQQDQQHHRGQGENAPRQQSEGGQHRQQHDRNQSEGHGQQPRQERQERQEPETQYRRGQDRFDRQDGDGQNRPQTEERPRTREFDERREAAPQEQPAPVHINGLAPSPPDNMPTTAAPDTVDAPPRPRRGRPRRTTVAVADAPPGEPAAEG